MSEVQIAVLEQTTEEIRKAKRREYDRQRHNTPEFRAWNRDHMRQYRAKHRETMRIYSREKNREWRAKHRERLRKKRSTQEYRKKQKGWGRDHYLKHRATYIEQSAQWQRANPERKYAIQTRYDHSARGRALRKVSIRRYQSSPKGREAMIRVSAKRRVTLKSTVATLTAAEWAEILACYNHSCAYCGRTDRPLTRDHVIPLSKGGHHIKENIVPACRSCNCKKHNKLIYPTTALRPS